MSKQAKQNKVVDTTAKWEKLRQLRIAEETSRRASGTWGELMLGEVLHHDSGSVFVHTWKGSLRPDPVAGTTARAAGVSAADWPAFVAWKDSCGGEGFRSRVVGWNLSEDEAKRAKEALIASHRAAGREVANPVRA